MDLRQVLNVMLSHTYTRIQGNNKNESLFDCEVKVAKQHLSYFILLAFVYSLNNISPYRKYQGTVNTKIEAKTGNSYRNNEEISREKA